MTEQIQGAEAKVKIGSEKVEKNRIEKNYRHPKLDEKIRTERNKQETRIIKKARQKGVNVPEVKDKEENSFEMEKISGQQLKNTVEEQVELAEKLAVQIARLHSENIIHGDLTTSNAIRTPENEVYLIDFGLAFHSKRIEDKAVDLHLLKQIFRTSHAKQEKLWQIFSRKYSEEGDEEVVEKVSEIEERARYK